MKHELYTVEITREIIVVATSPEEAEELALQAEDDQDPDMHAQPMRRWPGNWEGDCLPFGYADPKDPDRTIAEWIVLGAAPNLAKQDA